MNMEKNEQINTDEAIKNYLKDNETINNVTAKFGNIQMIFQICWSILTAIVIGFDIVKDNIYYISNGYELVGFEIIPKFGIGFVYVIVYVIVLVVVIAILHKIECDELRKLMYTETKFNRIEAIKHTRMYDNIIVSDSWNLNVCDNSYYDVDTNTRHNEQADMYIYIDAFRDNHKVSLVVPISTQSAYELFKNMPKLIVVDKYKIREIKK